MGTALRLHKVWVLAEDAPPHVWMGRNGRIHPHPSCACISHFFGGETRFGVADVETALIHLYRCQGDEAFFAFETAWRKGLLSHAARSRIRGVGIVDFVVGGRVIIEADGKENHDGSTARHKDLRRDAAASALGYETLRFDYAQIVHDWPSVQSAILAAVRRARV